MAEGSDNQRWREEPRDRSLRASDGDREAAAELLRAEHLDGRIDDSELEDRLERCLSARTYAELDELVADLPRPPTAERRRPRYAGPPRLAFLLIPLFVAAVVLSHGHALFLLVPLAFFLFLRTALFGGRWGCFGPGYGAR